MNRSQAESDSSGEIRAAATIKRGIPSRASESQSDGGWAMRLARWSYFRPSARDDDHTKTRCGDLLPRLGLNASKSREWDHRA